MVYLVAGTVHNVAGGTLEAPFNLLVPFEQECLSEEDFFYIIQDECRKEIAEKLGDKYTGSTNVVITNIINLTQIRPRY